MSRPLVATVDIDALRFNLSIAKKHAPSSRVWAVVKANAYGHGLANGMRGFAAADGLALIEPEAAVALREAGWSKPILLLEGFFDAADLELVARHRLETAVHCIEQVEMIERARLPAPLRVHLKMNTGMNRLGFRPEAFRRMHERLSACANVDAITLMMHFANADDPDNALLPPSEQLRRFRTATAGMSNMASLANSAADLLDPQAITEWVRPGIMLYGATPGLRSAQEFGLRPAMTLTSRIIGVQEVAAGEAVGYGSRFVAPRDTRIGVVACGYADGYPRHAPNGTPILVDGVRTAIAGRVSMDMITVDLGPVPGAGVGSKVTLWGEGLPIDEVAHAAGTIGYELMCAVAPRVPVVAIEAGAGNER